MAPITSAVRFPLSPAHVLIAEGRPSGLAVTSMALLDQIRTVDKTRLMRKLGQVGNQSMSDADEAIKISLGLIRI
jgi:mRNA interferase MazF